MKIVLSLALLICGSAFGASSGSGNISNVLMLGGISQTDNLNIAEINSQGYTALFATSADVTGNAYSKFTKNGAVYQVTSGNSFHLTKICALSGVANRAFQLVSGTAAVGQDTATALTGGIYSSGAASLYTFYTAGAYTYQCYDFTYTFPSASFPGIQTGVSDFYSILVIGKETTP